MLESKASMISLQVDVERTTMAATTTTTATAVAVLIQEEEKGKNEGREGRGQNGMSLSDQRPRFECDKLARSLRRPVMDERNQLCNFNFPTTMRQVNSCSFLGHTW